MENMRNQKRNQERGNDRKRAATIKNKQNSTKTETRCFVWSLAYNQYVYD